MWYGQGLEAFSTFPARIKTHRDGLLESTVATTPKGRMCRSTSGPSIKFISPARPFASAVEPLLLLVSSLLHPKSQLALTEPEPTANSSRNGS